jgi:PEP-CTERM motif-containing protein
MMRARSVCLVALLGLVFVPMVVSARQPCATAVGCVTVPEPATGTLLLIGVPAAAMLLRGRLKRKK